MLSVKLMMCQQAWHFIVSLGSGVVDDFLRHAMTECNQESLVAGILLVRQACLEGQHVFRSYDDWFQVSCFLWQPVTACSQPLLTGSVGAGFLLVTYVRKNNHKKISALLKRKCHPDKGHLTC